MGRRAKKAPVVTKKRPTLAKRFKCPFCANENVVECTMRLREGIGSLNCRICDASFQMPIHHLHEPIDVFSEWLDACEAAEKGVRNTGDAVQKGSQGLINLDNFNAGEYSVEKQTYAALGLDESEDDSE